MTPSEHYQLVSRIVAYVFLLGVVTGLAGAGLAFKGFQESTMLIQIAGGCVTGLLGLVSLRGSKPEDGSKVPPDKIVEETTKTETTTKAAPLIPVPAEPLAASTP